MQTIHYKNYEIELSPVSIKYTLSKVGVATNKTTGETYPSKTAIAYDVPFDYLIQLIIELEANEKENQTLRELIDSYKEVLSDIKTHFEIKSE